MGKHEELAVIRGADIGTRDCGRPVLWFETEILNGGALQVMDWEEAGKLIKAAGVYSVKYLNGCSCVVEIDDGSVRFVRLVERLK